jgi:hypothetical protein
MPPQKPKGESKGSSGAVRGQHYGLATQDGSQTTRAAPAKPTRPSKQQQPHTARPSSTVKPGRDIDPKLGCRPPIHPVPVTPAQALKTYQGQLTEYELSEILDYPKVYHTGALLSLSASRT